MYLIKKIFDTIISDYKCEGNTNIINFKSFSSTNSSNKNDLTFIGSNRSDKQELLKNTKAGIIICDKSLIVPKSSSSLVIKVDKPKLVFSLIFNFFVKKDKEFSIHNSSLISSKSNISKCVSIGTNCNIGNVIIDQNTIIHNNVTLHDGVVIGKNVEIHSGVVIGSDGYGYSRDNNNLPIRFPHFGGVIIEDNVHIGANSCIDNGSLTPTIIKSGTKIDNLVHIGHNVNIGKNVLIAAQSSIAGSCQIGDNSEIWTGVKIADTIKIGQNSYIGMGSVVIDNIPENKKCFGNPARVFSQK